jgi:general stress protein 26
MKKNVVDLAGKLMDKSEIVTLASVNEDGFPRICAMANVKSEGIKTIWMATGTHSKKTAHFLKNPKASVCAFSEKDSLTLIGNISIISDNEIKHDLWQDWFIEHFPKGKDDPEYCVLKFEAQEATIYVDELFETISL